MSFGYQMLGFGGGGVPLTPIQELLATALARYTADDIVGSFPVTEWTNSGTGGTGYDLDTVVGTAANLVKLPSNAARVPSATGNHIYTPNTSGDSVAGSIEIIARVSADDWTPASDMFIVSKWHTGNCWLLSLDTDGTLRFFNKNAAASANIASNSTAATGFTNGTTHWVRVTWNDTTDKANYYTADDSETIPVSWTQLGTADVSHVSVGINSATQVISIGAYDGGGSNWFQGNVHRTVVYDGIGGTVVADFNPADASPNVDTWTSSGAGGEVWTISADAFVNATDYDAVYAKGSVGIETTTEQAIADPMTIFMVLKQEIADPSATEVYFNAKSSGSASIGVNTEPGTPDKITLYAGSNIYLAEPYQNALSITTIQHNGDATTKLTDSSMGSVIGDAGARHLNWGTLFSNNAHTVPTTGAMYEFIIFDSALSEDDVALVENYLETKYELANAETLLATALVHYTPADIVGTFPVTEWTNSGTGGTDYDLDTVVGTAANLISLPSNMARRDSTSGNYFSTPDSAANSVSSAFTIIAYASFDVWDTGTYVVAGKYGGGSDRCYRFYISGGNLTLTTSTTGSNYVYSYSTSATGFSNGTGHWIRVTFDNSANTTNFYTSDDAATTAVASVSWAQLGNADISHVVGTLVDSSHEFEIGSDTSGTDNKATGNFGRVVLLNSTDPTATPVLDFNPADATANTSTWTSSGAGGETWTINGDAFVNTTDYAGLYAKGGVGIETTAGTNIAAPYTVIAAIKHIEVAPAANVYLHSHRAWDGTNLSYLYIAGGNAGDPWVMHQDSGATIGPNSTNDLFVISAQYNSDATSNMITDGGSATGDIGEGAFDFGSLFMNDAGAQASEMVMWEYMVFGSKLTASEIGTIRNHLLTKYGV